MKQRLSLARTMAHDPQLLILDEPASGLDPRARIELRELLKELRALGKTIMISSHILTELAEMCTHIGIIETGRLLVSGEVGDVLHSLQPHRILQIRVLYDAARAAEVIQTLPGVREVRPDTSGPLDPGLAANMAAGDILEPASSAVDETAGLIVDYTGDERGLSDLLRALVVANVPVVHFAEQSSDLEDIFMQVTRGVTQ
jgi:ABC-2 type transport system ATP-binding protein